jgi:hypothetical protein
MDSGMPPRELPGKRRRKAPAAEAHRDRWKDDPDGRHRNISARTRVLQEFVVAKCTVPSDKSNQKGNVWQYQVPIELAAPGGNNGGKAVEYLRPFLGEKSGE